MNTKLIIGSITAVVILILVSFSSVVGYSSVKSESKITSPLFSVRNNKGDISSDYLGKGKAINILLPRRNSNVELVEKWIERINEMEEVEFENLINTLAEIKNKLYVINKLSSNFNDFDEKEKPVFATIGEPWYPGCFSQFFLYLLAVIVLGIMMIIEQFLTWQVGCYWMGL